MSDADADILPLADDFPPATREQWLKLVARLLKGAPCDRKLGARTYDGLTIQPLYAGTAQERAPVGRRPGADWQILQRVDHPDPAAANAEARHDHDNGATGLSLIFAGSIGAHGFGGAARATGGPRAAGRRRLPAAGWAPVLRPAPCGSQRHLS